MWPFTKPLRDLTKQDLDALIHNKVPEGKQVDYKRGAPALGSNEEKREFLADVSSFANTDGGYLLYGVEEADMVPVNLPGIGPVDGDALQQQVNNLLRTSLEPRLPLFDQQLVSVGENTNVLVMRIGASWASPHVVRHGDSTRFFARNSSGKFQLDVHQLRAAFLASERSATKLTEFRTERLARVISDDIPAALAAGPKLVVHLLPLVSFTRPGVVYQPGRGDVELRPLTANGWSRLTPNFEGAYVTTGSLKAASLGYAQLFRTGCIEGVDAYVLVGDDGATCIRTGPVEEAVCEFVAHNLQVLRKLDVQPPIFVCASLVGVRGATIPLSREFTIRHRVAPTPYRRDVLQLPEVHLDVLEGSPTQMATMLRPAFDVLANAFGLAGSLHYNPDGTWKLGR